jgi:lia operon protein LiaG
MRAALTIPFAFLVTTAAAAQQPERFQLQGQELAVYNLVGAVTVEPGTGEVTVEVSRTGRDGAKLRVEQGDVRGAEALRVIYPEGDILAPEMGAGSSTTLRVREDGTFGDGDRDGGPRRRNRDDGRRVEIRGSGAGLAAGADLRVRLPAGKQLAVYLAVGKVSLSNVQGELRVDAHNAPVTASGVKGQLSVDVGAGMVRVTEGEGTLDVDTGSGSVEVSRFKGRALTVDTGSGHVNGTELTADGLSIETGSGNIELAGISSPSLSLETGSGTVRADLRTDLESLRVETGSGDVAVTAPATLDAEVEIETSSGDIESDFPLQVTRHARDHLVGRIGTGKGRIAVETGSGDVRLIKRPG